MIDMLPKYCQGSSQTVSNDGIAGFLLVETAGIEPAPKLTQQHTSPYSYINAAMALLNSLYLPQMLPKMLPRSPITKCHKNMQKDLPIFTHKSNGYRLLKPVFHHLKNTVRGLYESITYI